MRFPDSVLALAAPCLHLQNPPQGVAWSFSSLVVESTMYQGVGIQQFQHSVGKGGRRCTFWGGGDVSIHVEIRGGTWSIPPSH